MTTAEQIDSAAKVMSLSEAQKHDLAALVARTLTLGDRTNTDMTDAAIWGFARGLETGFRRGREMRYGRVGQVR